MDTRPPVRAFALTTDWTATLVALGLAVLALAGLLPTVSW